MKKSLFAGILAFFMIMPNIASAKTYSAAHCFDITNGWGKDDVWFCGPRTTYCSGQKIRDRDRKYYYYDGGVATVNGAKYTCCGGTGTANGKFVAGSGNKSSTTERVNKTNGYCTRTKTVNRCDKVSYSSQCNAPTACNSGYELKSGSCVKKCSNGKVASGNSCVCPSGQEESGGKCVAKCSSDQEKYNGTCVAKCGSDQERYNGTCVAKCTSGQERVNGKCQKKCDPGYELKGDNCIKKCNSGYEVKGDQCVKICTEGFVASGDTCKKVCAAGYESKDNINCTKICSAGYQPDGDECVKKCDPGYELMRRPDLCCKSGQHVRNNACTSGCPGENQAYESETSNKCTECVPDLWTGTSAGADGEYYCAKCDKSTQFFSGGKCIQKSEVEKQHSQFNLELCWQCNTSEEYDACVNAIIGQNLTQLPDNNEGVTPSCRGIYEKVTSE